MFDLRKSLILIAFQTTILFAESQSVGPPWRGLHNSDASILINDNESQDLLNVDITDSGFGIRKRNGYSQFRTVGLSSHGVRGGYYFRDTGGTNTLVFCNERDCAESINSGAFSSAFITTDTSGSYYDFTDSNGYIWRANNNRDEIWRYDGTNVTYYPNHPAGNQIEATPDRLVISGTSANPSRLNFSAAADFTNFATGSNSADPFTIDIGVPGTEIMAIKWFSDRLLFWTRTYFGYWFGLNQYNDEVGKITESVGTNQPFSIVEDFGILYWQGQDKHFYRTDGSIVEKISQNLDVSKIVGGEEKQWISTTESDFLEGTQDPSGSFDTSSNLGDLILKNGTQRTIDAFTDGDMTANPAWTEFGVSNASFTIDSSQMRLRPTITGSNFRGGAYLSTTTSGDFWRSFDYSMTLVPGDTAGLSVYLTTRTPNDILLTNSSPRYNGMATCCSGTGFSPEGYQLSITTFSIAVLVTTSTNNGTVLVSSAAFPFPDGKERRVHWFKSGTSISVKLGDTEYLNATDSTGNFSSFDYLGVAANFSNVTNSSVDEVRFDNFLVTPTSGTFQSTAFNIGTGISSWGTFIANHALDGGTINYAIYGDTNSSITISNSATFSSSQTITNGSVPTIATSAYVTWVSISTRTARTQNPTVNDVTIRWNEGTITRHFAAVDKNHRIIWSVAEDTATVPNVTYIYDRRFDSWLKYSIPIDIPVKVVEDIYFGGVSTGVVYKFPSGNTDDGSAFTAYWKSKDFIGDDPFSEKKYTKISALAKTYTGSNLDVEFTVNMSSTISRNFSLTDSNGVSLRRLNYYIPARIGTFFNIRFLNDDSNAPFEVYSMRYDFEPLPWRVMD